MLTFEDLLAAKVAIQMDRLTADAARAALQAALAGNRTLVQELERAGTVDPQTARTIAAHARRCSFLKAESVYVSFLRQRHAADEPTIERARARQRQEGLRQRLGDLLTGEGSLARDVDQAILAEARAAFVADNAQVTDRYVAKGFEGIERPSATVSEVLGQTVAVAGESTPASPYDSRIPEVADATAAVGRAAGPPRAQRTPLPAAAASDGAVDLRSLGHSQELVPPRAALGGFGAPSALAPPPAAPAPAAPHPVKAAPSPAAPAPATPVAQPGGPSPLQGTGLDTRYEVKKKLGEGGMGAVYLAREIQTGRDVALKLVLDREKSQEAAGRFKREILATSMCGHENVIEIYDAGPTEDGSYFMAMEYVPGEELADIIKREGAVAVPRAIDFFVQILHGIQAVHSAGIVHRDLKPQNFRIFKDPATGEERVKIMDFGIARIKDADQQFADQFYRTMGGKITGSPAYLAPESITEAEVDGRADLYSLGIALFRIVTGKLPFSCKEPMEYLPKHLYEKPPVPSVFAPTRKITPEVDALILKLLAKQPDQRYQSAEDVIADIESKVRPGFAAAGLLASQPETTDGFESTAAMNRTSPAASARATPATRAAPATPGVPATPRAADLPPNAETLPADPKLMAELARMDAAQRGEGGDQQSLDMLAADIPAPNGTTARPAGPSGTMPARSAAPPSPTSGPTEKKGCLGFLFKAKKA